MTNFGQLHARWYDKWFHAKDYASEVDQLRAVFAKEDRDVHSILDIGCGTARHLELLAWAGHDVTGVDRSPAMIAVATERLAASGSTATVVVADAAELDLDRTFDAVIMMSWVFSYFVSDEELFAILAVVHRQLRAGGLLMFDAVDGTTLLRSNARAGFNVIDEGDVQFIRASRATIHPAEQIYEIDLRMWAFEDDRVVGSADETHPVRYFLPREVELILDVSGFELLGSAPLAGSQPWQARALSRLFWARKVEEKGHRDEHGR